MTTDWPTIASRLISECPSATYREQAAAILQQVELLGPLTSVGRPAEGEFKRVYRFLHYNEPARILAVVTELLQAFGRAGAEDLSKRNAWNYVVGAFDRWICRARILYLAIGLVEGILRSRLDARLTDAFGSEWPSHDDAVPSTVRDLLKQSDAQARLDHIRRLLDEADGAPTTELIDQIRAAAAGQLKPSLLGSEYVKHLPFGQLRSFFQAKKLWKAPARLELLFSADGKPLLRSDVDHALGVIQDARNETAHYRPTGKLSFATALYETAKLARWLGVDLQHFYGSVDTRLSTELSHLLDGSLEAPANASDVIVACSSSGCAIPPPIDNLLSIAPTSAIEVSQTRPFGACLFHRVQLRVKVHRPADA